MSRKSKFRRLVKEMNILSAHQSSNPTCPATQSVSQMCRNEVDESAPLVLPTLLALATAEKVRSLWSIAPQLAAVLCDKVNGVLA